MPDMPEKRPYAYPINLPGYLASLALELPLDFVGISKRAEKDVRRIELFLRAAQEGIMRRVVDAVRYADPDNPSHDPFRATQLAREVKSLSVQSSQLAADYIDTGYRTVKKLSLATIWQWITRDKDPDVFKDLRERARLIAMEFGFPYDVQAELGVKVPPPPPV